MVILGFNGGVKFQDEDSRGGYRGHDASAVLVRDGQVVAAIEEERLIRLKHTNCFPAYAIRWCLETAGVRWDEVDQVVTNMTRVPYDVAAVVEFWGDSTRRSLDGVAWLNEVFERAFGVDVADRLRFCHHHVAHAWSAFVPSGFETCLVLSLDGAGDNKSGMVFVGRDGALSRIRDYALDQSLGHLYTELIRLLGYSRFDEYKVMGLAPYGDPRVYGPLLGTMYELLPEGNYRLASRDQILATLHEAGLLAAARRKGEPFSRMHIDFAAAVQASLEAIVLHVATHFRERTQERRLCLAGGVAHNCTLNGKLLRTGLFDRVFVQPAAHDAGGSLGAAWWAYYADRPAAPRPSFRDVYFGADLGGPDAIRAELRRWGGLVDFEPVGDAPRHAARLLADGAVVAWAQGRCEFGPRALGNRSIVADPRPAANRQIINDLVKKREAYRPFAPSVLLERAAEFFDMPAGHDELPFMIAIVEVREPWRDRLGAVTHVDGTARVQTVSRDVNPKFWALIHEFERLTGVGVVLNTSFNNNAEPIVSSVRDAVICFLTTAVEYLFVGDFLVTKRAVTDRVAAYGALAPDVPPHRKLVRKKCFGTAGTSLLLESTKSPEFGPLEAPISPELWAALQEADGATPLSTLLRAAAVTEPSAAARVVDECLDLWASRLLVLCPAC